MAKEPTGSECVARARRQAAHAKRLVVKVGTNVLSTASGQLDTDRVATLCQQVHRLRQGGRESRAQSQGPAQAQEIGRTTLRPHTGPARRR